MDTKIIKFGWVLLLAGCGQSGDSSATRQPAPQASKKPAYCFFKEEETKNWAAHRDTSQNIVLTGKAHVKDSRYKAVLGEPVPSGASADIAPTIGQNDGAFGAPGDWWDLSAAIPNSAKVGEVVVHCGEKVIAKLEVPPKS